MVNLESLAQAPQDRDRILYCGGVYQHRLEAPLQRGVLLDVPAVFVERGRADAVQLAASQHGLEHIARVGRSLGLASADDGVQLVDKEQDASLAGADFVEHGLEPLFKLAPVLGPGHQRTHVQRKDRLLLHPLGHIAAHDALRQTLDDRGLAHAWLADEHWVVLGLAREDADGAADLFVAPNHRVEPAGARLRHQVESVALKGLIASIHVGSLSKVSFACPNDCKYRTSADMYPF